jgi:hypothetical protein
MARRERHIVGGPFRRKTSPMHGLVRDDLILNIRMALDKAVEHHENPVLSVQIAKAHFLEGRTVDEIATIEGMTPEDVRAILSGIETHFRKNAHKII